MAISDYASVGLGDSGAPGVSSVTNPRTKTVAVPDLTGIAFGFGPASEATNDRGGLNPGRPLG